MGDVSDVMNTERKYGIYPTFLVLSRKELWWRKSGRGHQMKKKVEQDFFTKLMVKGSKTEKNTRGTQNIYAVGSFT